MINRLVVMIFVLSLLSGPYVMAGAEDDIREKLENATQDDKISYAIGLDVGNNIKKVIAVNPEFLIQGIKDSMAENPRMTQKEIQAAIAAFKNLTREKQIRAREKELAANKTAGNRFLEENKAKEGVTVTASGLQYKVIKKGDGDIPRPEDRVKCHYKGSLIDGREFDSSYRRNQPAIFAVNGVIRGWAEALQLMETGAKWMLWIPPELAYGDRGAGDAIAPGATLVFEVELLSIE